MKTLLKGISAALIGTLLSTTALALNITSCNVMDFTAGGSYADACYIGPSDNDKQSDINALGAGTGWTASPISVQVSPRSPSGFDWEIAIKPFEEAIFTVKQSSPSSQANIGGWVAYQFSPLNAKSGTFSTLASFEKNDYSHVKLYTRGGGSDVPEMDASGAGVSLALLGCLLALFRERSRR